MLRRDPLAPWSAGLLALTLAVSATAQTESEVAPADSNATATGDALAPADSAGAAEVPPPDAVPAEAGGETPPASPEVEPAVETAPAEAGATTPASETSRAQGASTSAGATGEGDTGATGAAEPVPKKGKGEVALRLGYSVPFGDLSGGNSMKDTAAGLVPLQIDILLGGGYFRNGPYLRAAVGAHGRNYDGCTGCFPLMFAAGYQAAIHTTPKAPVDFWIGAGVGFNLMNLSGTANGIVTTSTGNVTTIPIKVSDTFYAFPELTAQAGVDFGKKGLKVGPYVNFTAAQYFGVSSERECIGVICSGQSTRSVSIDSKSFHYWLNVGVKAAFVAL
jgi:hypothetical protein